MRSNIRWALLVAGVAGVLAAAALGCRPAAKPVVHVRFDQLSPQMQQKLRAQNPNIDQTWWQLVQQACAQSAFVNCLCCNAATATGCNPNNWDCCASAAFAPGDGAECAFGSGLCNCPSPPAAPAAAPAAPKP